MKRALVLGLLIALASLHAEAKELPLTILSDPPKAQIWEGDQFVGVTGEPVNLSQDPHQLTLKLPNHQDVDVSLTGADIDDGVYPKAGPLKLPPLGAAQALRDLLAYHPWRVGVVLGLLGLTVGLVRHGSRMKQRQNALDRLRGGNDEEGSEQRSLIMETLGDYRVVSSLGRGGMAEVYLAVPEASLDPSQGVAIKVLNREMRDRPDLVERFEREVMISQELTHPGIVGVKGHGWHNGRLYLIMELVEGKELRELLPTLDPARIPDILSQLMQAVDFAHGRGIFHRDLKPENVMVTSTGRVKVMDFGLGRAVDSQTLTQAGSAMGTPRYIAPETVASAAGEDAADQYSLGVMAFEMLVGRPPFESDEVLYLLYCHGNVEPPRPSSLAPYLSPEIDEVLLRMLEKDPRARFRTVEEARARLLGALREFTGP